MNAVVSVIGKDRVGILAFATNKCQACNANIIEVSQTILNEYFAMIMIVNIDKLNLEFVEFVDEFEKEGSKVGLEIHVMHEDIFNSMHKI